MNLYSNKTLKCSLPNSQTTTSGFILRCDQLMERVNVHHIEHVTCSQSHLHNPEREIVFLRKPQSSQVTSDNQTNPAL